MCAFQLFLSVDPSLGRLDYTLLSDQALMEMLIEGFDDETKRKYQDKNGMYLDVCKWSHVECDDDERVVEIHIEGRDIIGSADLFYIPPKVKSLDIIPGFDRTELKGSADLTHLPDGMESLSITGSRITGEVDLTQLPVEMKSLILTDNQLEGQIDLTKLPRKMQLLLLNFNHLSGSLVIKNMSEGMYFISLEGNHFNASAVVDVKTDFDIDIRGCGVDSVVDENGKAVVSKWIVY